MTYKPHPIDLSGNEMPKALKETDVTGVNLLDRLASESHNRWARMRISQGWRYGESKDEAQKLNPQLKPYEELSEAEKEDNRKQIIETMKLAEAFGYAFVPPAADPEAYKKPKKEQIRYWNYAQENYWSLPYSGEKQPEYSIPLILGLVAQGDVQAKQSSVMSALNGFLENKLRSFLGSKKRTTPVYILSELENPMECSVAEQLCKKWDIQCIHVRKNKSADRHMLSVVADDPTDYIARNCFALIALWDGLDSSNGSAQAKRCHRAVRTTLLETEAPLNALPNEAPLGDSRPVFNLVLNSSGRSNRHEVRELLPHILEAGETWYLINNSDKTDKKIAEYKKDRYNRNVKAISKLNAAISKPNIAAKTPVYDLLLEPMHGINKSADATNMRFLRLDSLASAIQTKHRKKIAAVSWCAGIGLCAFALLSDLGNIVEMHSIGSALFGVLAVIAIITALLLLASSKGAKFGHNNLRLLAECLRVKTYWNALGLSEYDADDGMNAKARSDLDYAVIALRGWTVLDEAAGYYDEGRTDALYVDSMVYEWLGGHDIKEDDKYSWQKVGQLKYARKTSAEFNKAAKRNNLVSSLSTVVVPLLSLVFIAILAADVIGVMRSGQASINSFGDLFTALYEQISISVIAENLFMAIISILPVIATCAVLYAGSRMYPENSIRYRWLAVQYQKFIWLYDRLSAEARSIEGDNATEEYRRINREKEDLLLSAGKMAVTEVCEWTALMLDNDIKMPF